MNFNVTNSFDVVYNLFLIAYNFFIFLVSLFLLVTFSPWYMLIVPSHDNNGASFW